MDAIPVQLAGVGILLGTLLWMGWTGADDRAVVGRSTVRNMARGRKRIRRYRPKH